MAEPTFSIITTCKGRLEFLKRTLPNLVAQVEAEIVVVDYDCPDGTKDWVASRFPDVRVAVVTDMPLFNLSDARNIGAKLARAPWLVFCDADDLLIPSFTTEVLRRVAPGTYLRTMRDTPEGGRKASVPLVCEATTYREIGGYDDALRGWGAEDWEIVNRLEHRGVREVLGPATLVEKLPHANEIRSRFYAHSIDISMVINHHYAMIKERHFETRGRWFTAAQRHSTYHQVEQAVLASLDDARGSAVFDIDVEGEVPPWTAQLTATGIRKYHQIGVSRLGQVTL